MRTFTYVIADDAGNSVTAVQEAPDSLSIVPKRTGDEALLSSVPMEFKRAVPCDFLGKRLKAWISEERRFHHVADRNLEPEGRSLEAVGPTPLGHRAPASRR
jgi:hypothetical protein